MSRTVFILGAGASKDGGAPLMAEFLEVAEQLLRANQVGDHAPMFELFFRARTALGPISAKSVADLFNVEEVLGLFEIAQLGANLPPLTRKEIEQLPAATHGVIATTLEHSLKYPVIERQNTAPAVAPPEPYGEFVQLVSDLRHSRYGDVAVISFNYDVALDYALHFVDIPVDYCLGAQPIPGALPVIKLHGALNWTTCMKCSCVTPYTMEQFFSGHQWIPVPQLLRLPSAENGDASMKLVMSRELHRAVHCRDSACNTDPVIVPPTWNKMLGNPELRSVWARAAKELSNAENIIIIIGYSLPRTDYYFRHLFALGTLGDALLRRIIVGDPNVSGGFRDESQDTVLQRVKELLSPALHRHVSPLVSRFAETIREVRTRLLEV